MNREHQLSYCTVCTSRKLDSNKDTICGLTNQVAMFAEECADFKQDPAFREPNAQVLKTAAETVLSIPPDIYERLRMEQNLIPGLMAGLVTGIVGAILWCVISVATEYQIGYMAVAIGAGVGFAIRYFGKGLDPIFGVCGGAIALLSCLLGNYFCVIGFVAKMGNIGYLEVFNILSQEMIINLMKENFSPMDLLFYGLAAYEGYKFSFRNVTEEDLSKYYTK